MSAATNILVYAWTQRKIEIMIIGLLILGIIILAFFNPVSVDRITSSWSGQIDPLIGFSTFIVAIFVWVGEIDQERRQSLPKKMTVVFRYEGRAVMCCKHASLLHEGDIRNLVQQVGKTMNNQSLLDFGPSLRIERDVVDEAQRYRHYFVSLELFNRPPVCDELDENALILWEPPFSEGPAVKKRADADCDST